MAEISANRKENDLIEVESFVKLETDFVQEDEKLNFDSSTNSACDSDDDFVNVTSETFVKVESNLEFEFEDIEETESGSECHKSQENTEQVEPHVTPSLNFCVPSPPATLDTSSTSQMVFICTPQGTFACPKCKKEFVRRKNGKAAITLHMINNCVDNVHLNQCKATPNLASVDRKDFRCYKCQMWFKSSEHLTQHYLIKCLAPKDQSKGVGDGIEGQQQAEEELHKCAQCHRLLRDRKSLGAHLLSHNDKALETQRLQLQVSPAVPIITGTLKPAPFTCSRCGNGFGKIIQFCSHIKKCNPTQISEIQNESPQEAKRKRK